MDELALARELADMADEISLHYFQKDPPTETKHDGSLVTAADKEIESALRNRIAEAFPGHGVLGEEAGVQGDPDGPMWVIDPIDGTNNFAAGIPIYGSLIGFCVDGKSQVGIASSPALSERYEAAIGDGARMNGKPISVSDVTELGESMVSSGGVRWLRQTGYETAWSNIVDKVRRDRSFGDFWGHMLVARGAAEVMIEPLLAPWDIVPLIVIIEEAGGRTTQFDGSPYPADWRYHKTFAASVLTSNGILHEEIRDLLNDASKI
jgi:histidinol-phosphatase